DRWRYLRPREDAAKVDAAVEQHPVPYRVVNGARVRARRRWSSLDGGNRPGGRPGEFEDIEARGGTVEARPRPHEDPVPHLIERASTRSSRLRFESKSAI